MCFLYAEVHGTENPLTKRPAIDAWSWQESARKQHMNERKSKMRINPLVVDPRIPRVSQVRTQAYRPLMRDTTLHRESSPHT